MRLFKYFLFISLMLSFTHAFDISNYLAPNESSDSVGYTDMVGPDGVYTMYYVGEEPVLMVHDDKIVNDSQIIKQVLIRYYFDKDYLKEEDINKIKTTLMEFNDSRRNYYYIGKVKTPKPPEEYCLQISGWTNRKCHDKESCILTCAAVPVCKYALEGLPDKEEFLRGIQLLGNNSDIINERVDYILEELDDLSSINYKQYDESVAESLTKLFADMRDIRERVNELKSSYLFKDLLPASGLQSYCAPVNYSNNAINQLVYLADLYDDRMSKLINIDQTVDELVSNTLERIQLNKNMVTQNIYADKLKQVEDKYTDLYSKYVKIKQILNDKTLASKMTTLAFKKEAIKNSVYKHEFQKSDITIKEFWVLSKSMDQLINDYYDKTQRIETVRSEIEKKAIIAQWDVELENVFLRQELSETLQRKALLDSKLSNSISPSEVDETLKQYENVLSDLNDVIEIKREHALDLILDSVVSMTNVYVDFLANIYYGVADGGYNTKKTAKSFVLPLTIFAVDFMIIVLFVGAFMHYVMQGKIRLHKTSSLLWMFIFISFFVAVSGGSLAYYLIINEKTVNTTFENFIKDVDSSNNINIVVDNRYSTIKDKSCAQMLFSELKNMDKEVRLYTINLGECIRPDGTKDSIDNCMRDLEAAPNVWITMGPNDNTRFTRDLWVKAIISGSPEYLKRCQLGTLLEDLY